MLRTLGAWCIRRPQSPSTPSI